MYCQKVFITFNEDCETQLQVNAPSKIKKTCCSKEMH